MVIQDTIITPLLVGLSSGMYCVVSCIPFFTPVMISEERTKRENIIFLGKFLLGRFFGYMLFGLIIGYIGQWFVDKNLKTILNIAMIILSVLIITHALGLNRRNENSSICRLFKKCNPEFPFILGAVMGINVCPPFLMSITYVLGLGGAVNGLVYFAMFFLGTSVYFIPIFFLGMLAKFKEIQIVGRVAACIVGVVFIIYSIYSLMIN